MQTDSIVQYGGHHQKKESFSNANLINMGVSKQFSFWFYTSLSDEHFQSLMALVSLLNCFQTQQKNFKLTEILNSYIVQQWVYILFCYFDFHKM